MQLIFTIVSSFLDRVIDPIRDEGRDERSGIKVSDPSSALVVLIVRSLQSRGTKAELRFNILLDWRANIDVAGDEEDNGEDEEEDFEVEFLGWGREVVDVDVAVASCRDERGWEDFEEESEGEEEEE